MQFPANFNKSLFTQEELDKISNMINIGQYKNITCVLTGDIDPIKEFQLQLLLSAVEPQFSGYEDKVRTQLEQLRRDGIEIETPKQEEAVNELINQETQLIKKKNQLLNSKRELENLLHGTEDKEVKEKIKETNSLIVELEDEYKKSFGKKDVKKALTENKVESEIVATPKKEIEETPKKEDVKVDEKLDEIIKKELPEVEKVTESVEVELSKEEVEKELDVLGVSYDKRLGVGKLNELLKNNKK